MSIQQCAQGFRMINILKNLGIQEDDNDTIDIDNNNIRNPKYNELFTFIQNIYLTCKTLGITPYIISSWIKDLFDFQVENSNILNNSSSLIEKYNAFDKKPLIMNSFPDNKISHETETNLDNDYNSDLKLKDESLVKNEIPFISQISHYISQKKKEFSKLENYKKALEEDTKTAESKRNQIELELEMIKQDEKYVMSFIDWYYDLKKELWERYIIKIEDFERFTLVINDFRKNGFNVPKIFEKYSSAISLEDKIKKKQMKLTSCMLTKWN